MHSLEQLCLLALRKVLVKFTATLILTLTKLAVLGNDLLALVSAPNFIVEFFFLVALVLDELDDHRFALLKLELLHVLLLLADQSSPAFFSLLSGGLSQSLLGSLLKSSRLQGERARFRRDCGAHGTFAERSRAAGAGAKAWLATLSIETGIDGAVGILFLDAWVDAI